MIVLCIIPARLQSSRLPNKVTLQLGDCTIIEQVYRNCKQVASFSNVMIATDSVDLKVICEGFGAQVIMTSHEHVSGTDRIHEAYMQCGQVADLIVNVQADEPFLLPEHLQNIIDHHISSKADVCTGMSVITDEEEIGSPNTVKVITDIDNNALYFSRSTIPYYRDSNQINRRYMKHIGVYSYRAQTLKYFTELPEGRLESIEKLEQLRLLERGATYACVELDYDGFGIDTLTDYEKALKRVNK